MNKYNLAITVIFFAASLLRLAGVFHPLDKASWRECDLGSIARNFVREGMEPLYPRIDWRGNGPGYAEMELPLYPYLTALTYEAFGVHDELGRVWAFLFSLGTLFFFYRLAREYLSDLPAVIAFAFFAFNPLVVEISTSVQPEGLMLMAYVGAAYFFAKWIRTGGTAEFVGSAAMTALALVAKASAAHIGLFFGILLIQKYGWGVIKQTRVWLFGIISILPTALWYVHAKNLWTTYGNSLGVSNEYHWIGRDFLTNPYFVKGIFTNELIYVWVCVGIVVAVFGLWKGYREEIAMHSLLWLGSAFVFYVIACRTTADEWAYYYHIFSVPAFALLFGLGAKKLADLLRETADTYSGISIASKIFRGGMAALVIIAVLATFAFEAKQVRANYQESRKHSTGFVFAETLKPQLTTPGFILASGGHCKDPDGYQVAYNASYMFYWLDRKGWNVCVEEQSLNSVHDFAQKGAVYFVAERKYLRETPHLEDDLSKIYSTVAGNDDFVVFELAHAR